MAAAVRSAGALQLVAWGGSGHLDRYGEDLRVIAADGAVDILTMHLYPTSAHAVSTGPGTTTTRALTAIRMGADAISQRALIAQRHGMPLLVEEMGFRPEPGDDRDVTRALVLGSWLRAAANHEVGTLPWMIAEAGRPDYDGLLIRADQDRATLEALTCD
jgi:hypothetical protein